MLLSTARERRQFHPSRTRSPSWKGARTLPRFKGFWPGLLAYWQMETVGIVEAKAKLSELCERVERSGEPIVVTRRGKPFVRIMPLAAPSLGADDHSAHPQNSDASSLKKQRMSALEGYGSASE